MKTAASCALILLLGLPALHSAAPAHPPRPAPVPPLVAALRTHLDALARDGFSGVVLIAKDGKPVFERAYGLANRADGVPNRLDTRFNLASMGKMLTGVAVLQLVEAGRLALDDKVGKYLPDYPNAEVRETVTIHQLLTHTAGLGNFWEEHGRLAKEKFKALSDYLPLFANQPLLFKPGTSFAYSNSGFMVLGLVIEAVAKESYFDYLRQHIYEPAGMKDSDAFELDHVVPRLATGFSRSREEPGVWTNNLYVNVVKGGPAGGSYATAGDLLRFARALTGGKLVHPESVALLTTGKVDYGTRRYAYGFIEERANGHRIFGHSGGHVGIADELTIYPDLGYTAIVLTNGDVEDFWDVQSFLKRQLVGATPESESYDLTRRLLDTTIAQGYEAGAKALAAKPADRKVRDGVVEQTGYRLLWDGKMRQAFDVFRLGAVASPKLSTVYLGLADAEIRLGEVAAAIEQYKKYLEMEPEDEEVRHKVETLTRRAGYASP